MPILDWLNKEEAVHKAKTISYRLLKPVKNFRMVTLRVKTCLIPVSVFLIKLRLHGLCVPMLGSLPVQIMNTTIKR